MLNWEYSSPKCRLRFLWWRNAIYINWWTDRKYFFLNAYHKEKKGNNDIVTFDFMSADHHHNFSTTIALTNDSFHISSINNHNAQVIFDENIHLHPYELPESSQWCYQLIKNMISLHCRYNNNFKIKKTCCFDFKNKSFVMPGCNI